MYHNLTVEQTLQKLQTSASKGLNATQVQNLVNQYGYNQLPAEKKETALQKFLKQFTDILILVLIFAGLLSITVHEYIDAAVIFVFVFINASMGYIQERRSEKAIEALQKLSTTFAKVLREGNIIKIETSQLVLGDIIILESGDHVPADARIIEAIHLEVSEAILTGESKPVKKTTDALDAQNLAIGDRINTLYKDTSIVFGKAKAVIVATGASTEMGKISQLLQSEHKEVTPLTKELNEVGKRLSIAAGTVIAAIFIIAATTGQLTLKETLLTAVSLAVAAIPSSLPAVVTIVLALGMSKLARRKAIVRRLKAVETLGATNYILTDKTGTLTQNKMSATNLAILNKDGTNEKFKIMSSNGDNKTFVNDDEKIVEPLENPIIEKLLYCAAICNDAEITNETANNGIKFLGDSTETTLLELVDKTNIDVAELREKFTRLYEVPFFSESKRMLVVVPHMHDEQKVAILIKGAPDVIAAVANEDATQIDQINDFYAKEGLRSLGFTYKEITKEEFEEALTLEDPETVLATNHEFLGIIAQKDPIRPEVKYALHSAKNAGILTIMVTGDHKLTATSIAKELGLITSDDEVKNGVEIEGFTKQQLKDLIGKVKVFARVSPQQKLAITKAVKSKGYIVAVTGDGVNDAPAIKAANIGIAMGISGTDVSKEVSDIVLQDDNYATIVEAVRQGRIIYDNLVKFITYLVSCNMSEIFVVGTAIFLAYPLPLLPIQILWINLVTDGLPSLALGMEPGEKDIMQRAPRNINSQGELIKYNGLLNKNRWGRMLFQVLLITIATFFVFLIGLKTSEEVARTAALTALAFSQLFHAFNSRSEKHSIFSSNLRRNKYLNYTFIASIFIQLSVVYTPFGHNYLKTVSISPQLFGIAVTVALIPVIGTEIVKYVYKEKSVGVKVQPALQIYVSNT